MSRTIPLGEDTNVRVSLKTVMAAVGVVGLAVYAWANIKGDVSNHGVQLSAVTAQVTAVDAKVSEHEKILIRMDAKLDYIVGGRRGVQPPPSTPSP